MERLIEFLKKYEDISDYKILRTNKLSNQLYFVLHHLETSRVVDTTTIDVTIYNSHDDKMGFANFTYSQTLTDNELNELIEKTIKQAKLIDNQAFTLPIGDVYSHELASNFRDISLNKLAGNVSKIILNCIDEEELSINSLEIFINKITTQVINSKGIDKTEIRYTGFYEGIPTYTKENKTDPTLSSVELFDEFSFGEFNEQQITADVKEKLMEVKDRYYAKTIKLDDVAVILKHSELADLFSQLIYEANYSTIYNHQNIYNIGDNLQIDSIGDKLSIILRGIIPGSPNSRLFDNEGIEFIDTEIIDRGVYKNSYGTGRFAQYLQKEPTGNLPCIDVLNGTLTDEEINANKYLECISFSAIQIDLTSDYIGGEVRLARYFDGEKIIPLTGISISGSLKDFFKDVKLSEEIITNGYYRGPKKALSKSFKII